MPRKTDDGAIPKGVERTSQIDPGYKLKRSEKWIPIVFGMIGSGIFAALIVGGVFGEDYYLPRGKKAQEATFFDEKIKDDTTYGLLIFMSTLMGFMRAIFDDIAGPQWSRIVNLHNTRGDALVLAKAYQGESLMWATILGARLWTKTSDALMIYFSFTDLYIFMGGFLGNVIGGIVVFFVYFDPLLDAEQQKDFREGRVRDLSALETILKPVGGSVSDPKPGKLVF